MDESAKRRFYRQFGVLLKKHRTRIQMTQEKLGGLAGLSRTSISNIEKGRQQIHLHQLAQLADRLEIPIEALVPKLDSPEVTPAHERLFADANENEVVWAAGVLGSGDTNK